MKVLYHYFKKCCLFSRVTELEQWTLLSITIFLGIIILWLHLNTANDHTDLLASHYSFFSFPLVQKQQTCPQWTHVRARLPGSSLCRTCGLKEAIWVVAGPLLRTAGPLVSCFPSGGDGHPIWWDQVTPPLSSISPPRICSSIDCDSLPFCRRAGKESRRFGNESNVYVFI